MDKTLAQYAERRVPRYTSYPTAPHFKPQADDTRHRQWLGALDTRAPVSLYLHIPFCREICWYCACNMKLSRRDGPVLAYARDLAREIDLVADALPTTMTVSEIHWGGGTPTAMPLPALIMLTGQLQDRFDIRPDAEIAFELDPRTFEFEMASGLAELGATRVSLGVQEFDAEVQQSINRIQPYETVRDAVKWLRDAGIEGINFDLMYGLPHQTRDKLLSSIDKALSLAPDRIALFGYAHVPWMAKNQRLVPEQALPDIDARYEQAEAAATALTDAGYIRIGLDHFARPGDKMAEAAKAGTLRRNFQGYTIDRADTVIGMGATSISGLPGAYVQNIGETGAYGRVVAEGKLPTAKAVELTADDKLRAHVIERLMCDLTVDLAEVTDSHGARAHYFGPELAACWAFEKEGLVTIEDWTVTVTERGRTALRVIASTFDAYMANQPEGRHARAV
ncbi:oxygen-independent coproporphyrinogen III oxidase [Cucumibacter marinus]|uniref:oxygen-independent coproporphyrinogen III oxidase n=1 Tax=Cucumibacter marinus TaxID=1121252 RepID=UPI000409CAC4|nr:oxygen-independent coproporphyrinogen III oxidase [Cucumibacter marinus]